MKKLITTMMMALALSVSAGGVKMKKAIKKGNAKVAAAAEKVAKKCGKQIKVSSNHGDAKGFKISSRTPENIVGVAAIICSDYVLNLANLCDDVDYKEAIVEFDSVKCIPNLEVVKEQGKSKYESKGKELVITHHPTTSGSSDAYTKLKNSL